MDIKLIAELRIDEFSDTTRLRPDRYTRIDIASAKVHEQNLMLNLYIEGEYNDNTLTFPYRGNITVVTDTTTLLLSRWKWIYHDEVIQFTVHGETEYQNRILSDLWKKRVEFGTSAGGIGRIAYDIVDFADRC